MPANSGAAGMDRTPDLTLTRGALFRLSYSSVIDFFGAGDRPPFRGDHQSTGALIHVAHHQEQGRGIWVGPEGPGLSAFAAETKGLAVLNAKPVFGLIGHL